MDFWPLHSMCYTLLTPVLHALCTPDSGICVLCTPDPCSWPFQSVLPTRDPCALWITYFWHLHFAFYLLSTPAFCVLHTRKLWPLLLDLCKLCVTYSWLLCCVHYLILTPALHVLLTHDPCTLCVTCSWPLQSVHFSLWPLLSLC